MNNGGVPSCIGGAIIDVRKRTKCSIIFLCFHDSRTEYFASFNYWFKCESSSKECLVSVQSARLDTWKSSHFNTKKRRVLIFGHKCRKKWTWAKTQGKAQVTAGWGTQMRARCSLQLSTNMSARQFLTQKARGGVAIKLMWV